MSDTDSKTYENDRSEGEKRDASAGWKAEYFHQGVRSVGEFTSRNGDHINVAGPQTGVSLSDFAAGGGRGSKGDGHTGDGREQTQFVDAENTQQ